MTQQTPELIGSTPELAPTEILPFNPDQATLEATQYGSDNTGFYVDSEIGRRLWLAELGDSRYRFPGHVVPEEDEMLRWLAFNGSVGALLITGEAETSDRIAKKLQGVTDDLSEIPDMEGEIVSLRAMSQRLIDRREQLILHDINRINTYIEIRESPYYAIVATNTLAATKDYSANYAKAHKLAELAKVYIDDDGRVRSILRQADGNMGYVTGRTYLFF